MTPPTFLNRRNREAPPVEATVRDIVGRLKENADLDTCRVLASATNTYIEAILRLRSNSAFTAQDMCNLTTIWEILLDVGRPPPVGEYAPKAKPAEPEVQEVP